MWITGYAIGLRSPPSFRGCKTQNEAEDCHQEDDPQGGDAVDAIDLEDVLLNVGEVEGEAQGCQSQYGQEPGALEESQAGHRQVAGNSDGSDGDVQDFREGAVVDDSAVPLGVDVAGLGCGGIVNLQSKCGNHDAGQGEYYDQIAHLDIDATRPVTAGSWRGIRWIDE